MGTLTKFWLRAFYTNYKYIQEFIIKKDLQKVPNVLQGYKNPILSIRNPTTSEIEEIEIDFIDSMFLFHAHNKHIYNYIEEISQEKNKYKLSLTLQKELDVFKNELIKAYHSTEFTENEYIIPSCSEKNFPVDKISHKGAMLLKLTQDYYPVPDFCILTSDFFDLPEKQKNDQISLAIHNLEKMTNQKLGSEKTPLVFAMRCAMPVYIPGLMPTYLNVGVIQKTFVSLKNIYGYHVAAKIYLNNLRNIYFLLYPDKNSLGNKNPNQAQSLEQLRIKIHFYYEQIRKIDEQLLHDPYYQINFFLKETNKFYQHNEILINTFLKNKQAKPSIILQKMVWTIRDKESYPGVLYTRNTIHGRGMQIESMRNIFGEEIMTGTVSADFIEFENAEQIKEHFPAVYHFLPKLSFLENQLQSPATLEFASESFQNMSLFALLQLNKSEMTGRAMLLATIDMYREKIIPKEKVIELIQSYHLKQIFSPSINQKLLKQENFFSNGFAVLPRSAISVKIYFSSEKALDCIAKGEPAGLCKEEFIPSDTVVMSELDAILSLNPAAIHVVTACMQYGVQAFLNLEKYRVKLENNQLNNAQGMTINEGCWITLDSNTKSIYKGKAQLRTAKFQDFMNHEALFFEVSKIEIFKKLKDAYNCYLKIVEDLKQNDFLGLNELIKILRTEKINENASNLINNWFDNNLDYYLEQILDCELGSHQEQQNLFQYLNTNRKIIFFKNIIPICFQKNLKGYKAGSFMLGRFLSEQKPIKFWMSFSPKEILFLLNESVLFEKYIHLLYEVGERNISKAKNKILKEGIHKINLKTRNVKNFITLKLTFKEWNKLKSEQILEIDKETYNLINELSKPFGQIYNYNKPWSINNLEKICKAENIPVPKEDEI